MFQSAIGFAALSDRPEPEIRKLVQRHNQRTRNPVEKIDLEVALRRIRRVRSVGYAAGYDLYMPGIGAIAWALRSETAPCSVVLSVGGPSDRVKSREANIIRTTRAAILAYLSN